MNVRPLHLSEREALSLTEKLIRAGMSSEIG